jgi:hypothetical protein
MTKALTEKHTYRNYLYLVSSSEGRAGGSLGACDEWLAEIVQVCNWFWAPSSL